MDKIIAFVEKVYNSILYNGLYIVLSLLFPFIIYKLKAGHEIIENLLDNHIGLNASLIIASFFLLAFSVWCVPTLAIHVWKFFTGNDTESHVLYKYLTVIYSGAGIGGGCINDKITPHLQIPIKYFAVFPWMIFIVTYVQVFFHTIYTVIGVGVLILGSYLIDKNVGWIKKQYDKWLFGNHFGLSLRWKYTAFLFVFALFTFIPCGLELIWDGIFRDSKRAAGILIGFNYLQLFAFYAFINYLENISDADMDEKTRYKVSRYNYAFVGSVCLLFVGIFFWKNSEFNLSMFSPIFVVVTIIAVLIMFIDICFTAQLLLTKIILEIKSVCRKTSCELKETPPKKLQLYRLIIIVLIVLYVFFTFLHSFNDHKIREVESGYNDAITDKRKSIEMYFDKWLEKNHNIKNGVVNDSLTIYLVSGPGGGSRAAAWFYLGMKKLDTTYGDNFYKHVFSISTVSGSTSGANMYLAEKHLQLDSIPPARELAKSIYSKNYFSSTFFGLLLGDGVEGMLGNFNNQTRNRNYYFQKEEMYGFIDAYRLKGEKAERARRYFENDLMYAYRNEAFPLFFINTTIIDYGKRGIFAPVKLNGTSIGVDLYEKYIDNCCNNRNGIPMVTCVNSSQAFPLINSYDYLEGAGRLCDGGLYDNSGCSTTLEIYQALRRHIKRKNMSNIRIVCLNIINGEITNDFCPKHTSSSILNTLTGVASLPFSGHESYAFFNLKRQVDNHKIICSSGNETYRIFDTVITIKPKKKYNLTRMLSKKAIDTIYADVNSQIDARRDEFKKRKILVVPEARK